VTVIVVERLCQIRRVARQWYWALKYVLRERLVPVAVSAKAVQSQRLPLQIFPLYRLPVPSWLPG